MVFLSLVFISFKKFISAHSEEARSHSTLPYSFWNLLSTSQQWHGKYISLETRSHTIVLTLQSPMGWRNPHDSWNPIILLLCHLLCYKWGPEHRMTQIQCDVSTTHVSLLWDQLFITLQSVHWQTIKLGLLETGTTTMRRHSSETDPASSGHESVLREKAIRNGSLSCMSSCVGTCLGHINIAPCENLPCWVLP